MPMARDSPFRLFGLECFGLTKRKRVNGELRCNQQEITARVDVVGPLDQSRACDIDPSGRGDTSCRNQYSRGEGSHIAEVKEREEDQEDNGERIESQLGAPKEDNMETIQEESRRRTQTISENCKQHPKEEQLEQEEVQQVEQREQLPELQQAEVDMEKVIVDSEVKAEHNRKPVNENVEVHDPEHTLSGKEFCFEKNIGNGKSRNESIAGVGGSGQGSLKGEFEQEISARADESSALSSQPAPELLPSSQPAPEFIPSKHKIFLSHSGIQKPFTEHLCDKLEAVNHYPFFDRRPDSLPKGVKFYNLIMQAAEECQVAILVLSEEFFTNSKWPMMELNKFVKAQELHNKRLRILPVFYKISRNEFNRKKYSKEWMDVWEDFQKADDSINVLDWKHAVSKIQGNNGIEYAGEIEGELEFIKRVVKAVCKLPGVQPDVKMDVSHVQSKEALSKPIVEKLEEVEQSNVYSKVQVVGLYGMGGAGKTTLSKVVYNQMYGKFVGKVCHVEFGGKESFNDLMKRVLQELTEASPSILDVQCDELVDILKSRMSKHKVFLVLDNIWEEHVEEVQKYLKAGYKDGSMVLLTSRSRDVLEEKFHIPLSDCMEMPHLDENDAIDVFLHYCNRKELTMEVDDTRNMVKRCVNKCYFLKEERTTLDRETQKIHHYHPLALKVLGMHLNGKRFEEWEKVLKSMESNKFKFKFKHENHPVFSVLRIGYDALDIPEQNIFLDLALIWGSKGINTYENTYWRLEREWLLEIHRMSKDDMEESVIAIQRVGLLENVRWVEELEFSIHDLYVEFAEAEAQHGVLSNKRFLLDRKGSDVPHELVKKPLGWSSSIRIVIKNSTAQSLKRANLQFCENVEVLDLDSCDELEEVDVGGMVHLRCIVITKCKSLRGLVGLDKLSDLIILRCCYCDKFETMNLKEVSDDFVGLKQLQHLDVSWCEKLSSLVGIGHATALLHLNASRCEILKKLPDDFVHLKQLQHLDVSYCWNLSNIDGIGHATALQHLDASGCESLKKLPNDFVGLKQLQHLDVSHCGNLSNIVGIGHATALQHLNVAYCGHLEKLPDDFVGLKQLQYLNVSHCGNLSSIVGIGHAIALQHLNAASCVHLEELPDDFVGLKQLQYFNVGDCYALSSIVGIGHATALQHLNASRCDNLKGLPDDFVGLKQLQHLDVSYCCNLSSIVGIGHATALQHLNVAYCGHLEKLPDDFVGLKQLQHLNVSHCRSLSSIIGIEHATALKHLDASGCESLKELPADFVDLKQLQHINVSGCKHSWNWLRDNFAAFECIGVCEVEEATR